MLWENKPYPYPAPHPKDLLGAFARVVGPRPDVGEVVGPRVLVALAARVHDDVTVLLRAFDGARDLGRVALVDDQVHLAGLAVSDVRQQLVQFVPLAVTRLREDRAMLRREPGDIAGEWATLRRAQWLRGRASDSRLREPGFESCAAALKPWASFFHSTLLQFTQLFK